MSSSYYAHVYKTPCISLLYSCSKEMFAKMEVIGQVCSLNVKGMLVAIAMSD